MHQTSSMDFNYGGKALLKRRIDHSKQKHNKLDENIDLSVRCTFASSSSWTLRKAT